MYTYTRIYICIYTRVCRSLFSILARCLCSVPILKWRFATLATKRFENYSFLNYDIRKIMAAPTKAALIRHEYDPFTSKLKYLIL